MVVVRWRQLF